MLSWRQRVKLEWNCPFLMSPFCRLIVKAQRRGKEDSTENEVGAKFAPPVVHHPPNLDTHSDFAKLTITSTRREQRTSNGCYMQLGDDKINSQSLEDVGKVNSSHSQIVNPHPKYCSPCMCYIYL